MNYLSLIIMFFTIPLTFVFGQTDRLGPMIIRADGSIKQEVTKMVEANREGLDYAVFFAVNEYANLKDLTCPIKESVNIAKELHDNYDFDTMIVRNPTLLDIKEVIEDYTKKFRHGSYPSTGQLLLFFSGHGKSSKSNGFFYPTDVNPKKGERFATALVYDYARDIINDIDCAHILVVVDACESISFSPNWGAATRSNIDRDYNENGLRNSDPVLIQFKSRKARRFMTSDVQNGSTPDNSDFAAYFLDGLQSQDLHKGYLTGGELFASYLTKSSPLPGGGYFHENELASRFIFFRKNWQSYSATTTAKNSFSVENAAWELVLKNRNCFDYRQYLVNYPNGVFVREANIEIEKCNKAEKLQRIWKKVSDLNLCFEYQDFSVKHPNSIYESEIRSIIKNGDCTIGRKIDGIGKMISVRNESSKTSSFWMSNTEVTVGEFAKFIEQEKIETSAEKKDNNGSRSYLPNKGFVHQKQINWRHDPRGELVPISEYNRPVVHVSWFDAIRYCNWKSAQDGFEVVYEISSTLRVKRDPMANGYRLPTEVEWETAALATGSKDQWSGAVKEKQTPYFLNAKGNKDGFEFLSPVGNYYTSALGIADLTGNVWEWCWTPFIDADTCEDMRKLKEDVSHPVKDQLCKVIRGGSWYQSVGTQKLKISDALQATDRNGATGIRIVRNY